MRWLKPLFFWFYSHCLGGFRQATTSFFTILQIYWISPREEAHQSNMLFVVCATCSKKFDYIILKTCANTKCKRYTETERYGFQFIHEITVSHHYRLESVMHFIYSLLLLLFSYPFLYLEHNHLYWTIRKIWLKNDCRSTLAHLWPVLLYFQD